MAFGVRSVPIRAVAAGRRPRDIAVARSSTCFLPLAIPDCHVTDLGEGDNPAPMQFTFSPSPSDNLAWGRPGANPSASWIRDQLEDRCAGGLIEIGETLEVNEGLHATALHTTADILNDLASVSPDPWLPAVPLPPRDGTQANLASNSEVWNSEWGNTIQGPVALVDAGSCDNLSFGNAGSLPITGIAWGAVYDVSNPSQAVAQGHPTHNVWIQLDVVTTYPTWGQADDEALGNVMGVGDPRLEVVE